MGEWPLIRYCLPNPESNPEEDTVCGPSHAYCRTTENLCRPVFCGRDTENPHLGASTDATALTILFSATCTRARTHTHSLSLLQSFLKCTPQVTHLVRCSTVKDSWETLSKWRTDYSSHFSQILLLLCLCSHHPFHLTAFCFKPFLPSKVPTHPSRLGS